MPSVRSLYPQGRSQALVLSEFFTVYWTQQNGARAIQTERVFALLPGCLKTKNLIVIIKCNVYVNGQM